ncbi:MAG: DMT family transporter [Paracoccaceae bacterium]|nr:MAG: DMT family transporter [Paracoccaceae bacterium]
MTDERLGIALRIGATLMFTAMVACIKGLEMTVPLGQIVFLRSFFALLPLVAMLWWNGAFPVGLATRNPLGHVARCLMGAASMFTSFATIRLLPLAEATMLSYVSPVMLALMGWAFLGERLGARRLAGVALGFGGVGAYCLPAFARQHDGGALLGVVLGLVTALLAAGALLQVRRLLLGGEPPGAIAFWFAVVSSLGGLATLPLGWHWPDPAQLALLLGAGLTGGVAQILMTLSFRHAEAAALAPFEYLGIFWTTAAGLLIFAEVPGWSLAAATPLILAGAMIATPPAPPP